MYRIYIYSIVRYATLYVFKIKWDKSINLNNQILNNRYFTIINIIMFNNALTLLLIL